MTASCDNGGSGEGNSQMPQVVEFTNGHVTLVVDRRAGTFDIELDGYTYVEGASSAIETGSGGLVIVDRQAHVPNGSLEGLLDVSTQKNAQGTVITLRYPQTRHGQITTFLTLLADHGGLTARMEFVVKEALNLISLIPIYVGPETGGGLFTKSDPSGIQILQNGSEIGFDFYADLQYADYPFSLGFLRQYATNEPSSSSNWNALLYDRENEEGLNMGYLSFESVIPEVIIGYDEVCNPGNRNREGWFTFQTRNGYLIARNDAAGSLRSSELFWMDRFIGRPQSSLEEYARMLADVLDIRLTHEPVAGWDSWYIYGDRIDQQIIEENLQGIVDHFLDYGMNSMQVDLGWEMVWGNWTGGNNFPCGMAYMAEQIRDAGLTPELWVAPFNAMRWSDVLQEHPDWAGAFHPLFLVLFQIGAVPLDLSRPEVVDFVASTGERFGEDFGFEAVKFDFAYYLQALTELYDPSLTVVEAYRRGVHAFRDALGWDKFFINILLNGINYGLCDSMRISIDSWACWGDVEGEECPNFANTTGYGGSGIRILLKALARRYYLNNVIWVNHPDQIFFRDYPGLIPQRSWATVVALSGAVMSLGEEIAGMSVEEIETYRRLLPNLGITGVPWDLFDREYPERWVTPLTGKDPGGWVLHLYSWGDNRDRTVNPPGEIPEGTRHHDIQLSDLELNGPFHAFEFWTQSDLGVIDDVLEIDVPARDCRVVVLRPVQERPYLLSSNRHVSQGGTDLHDPAWNPASGTLAWSQDLVLGFEHTVYVDPGDLPGPPSVSASVGALASTRAFGDLWAVDIIPASTGPSTITLSFPLQ
ncbi:alpha-galactosidase [Thermodesulfobacteriota bacterium]